MVGTGAVISKQAFADYKGPGRLVVKQTDIVTGLYDGRLPVPGFLTHAYDRVVETILGPKERGKEDKEKEGPGPFPEPGGTMEYRGRNMARFFPKTGERAYQWLKRKAENRGYYVRELWQPDIENYYRSGFDLQGYEKITGSVHEIGVMTLDKDRSAVSGWKKAGILAHELMGAEYFTRRGKSHEANHSQIESMADGLLRELATQA